MAERGTCRRCGCTDNRACEGGCSWVDASKTLCTACDSHAPIYYVRTDGVNRYTIRDEFENVLGWITRVTAREVWQYRFIWDQAAVWHGAWRELRRTLSCIDHTAHWYEERTTFHKIDLSAYRP